MVETISQQRCEFSHNENKINSRQGSLKNMWTRLRSAFNSSENNSLRAELAEVIKNNQAISPDVSPEESAMLLNILEFGNLRIEDVMVPRADIVAIEQSTPVEDMLDIFVKAGHSRIPIFHDNLDDPIGMVHIKDLIALLSRVNTKIHKNKEQNEQEKIRSLSSGEIIRKILFVPPSMSAADLLVKMQTTRVHMAIVVDEYGGTDGLVTIEDLVEEIVGDIVDEHDTGNEPLVIKNNDGSYTANARASVAEIEQLFGTTLVAEDEEDIDTIGGFVFSLAGRVPVRGELIKHHENIEFEVIDCDSRRLKKLKIHLKPNSNKKAVS